MQERSRGPLYLLYSICDITCEGVVVDENNAISAYNQLVLSISMKKNSLFYSLAQDASWLSICNIDLTPKPIQVPLKPIKEPLVFIVFVEVPRSGAAMLLRIF